jgi:hypothetical protein
MTTIRSQDSAEMAFFLAIILNADVGQSDRVQHTRCCFPYSRRRIARSRLQRYGLGDDGTDLGKIEQTVELLGVPKGTAGDHNRVGECDIADADRDFINR